MMRLSHFAAPLALGGVLFLGAGCAHEHPDTVPSSATVLTEGTETVSATAPQDGMVYIYDISADKPLYVGKVNTGDTVKVDAKENKLYLNDHVITKRDDLPNDHRYKVFFERADLQRPTQTTYMQPAAAPAAAPAGSVIVPDSNRRNTTVVVPQQQPAQGTTVVVPQQQQPAPSGQGTTVVVPPPPAPQR